MKGYPQAAFGSTVGTARAQGLRAGVLGFRRRSEGSGRNFSGPAGTSQRVPVAPRLNRQLSLGSLCEADGATRAGPPRPKHVADLCFTVPSRGPSAFLPLEVVRVRGLRPDGVAVNNTQTAGASGRVVAVGEEPLLEIGQGADGTVLIIYGQPTPVIKSRPTLSWIATRSPGSPHSQWISPPATSGKPSAFHPTNRTMFYRARRQ